MSMTQAFHNAGSGSLKKPGSKLLSARLPIMALLVLLTVMSLKGTALGDAGCFDRCEQSFSRCLVMAQGNPTTEALCQDNFDECSEICLIQP